MRGCAAREAVAGAHEREKRFYTLNGADKLYHMAFMFFLLLLVLYRRRRRRFTLDEFGLSHRSVAAAAAEMQRPRWYVLFGTSLLQYMSSTCYSLRLAPSPMAFNDVLLSIEPARVLCV